MKYLFNILAIVSFGMIVNAQVGINTTSPNATLDVSAKRDASGNIVDTNQYVGLQTPRLTRAELTNLSISYGASQQGTSVYITDVTGGNANDQRINMTSVGYYYFDGSVWKRMQTTDNSSSGSVNSTVYKARIGGGNGILNIALLADDQYIDFSTATGSNNTFHNGSTSPMIATGILKIQEAGMYSIGYYFRYGSGIQLSALDLFNGGFAGIKIFKNGTEIDRRNFSGANISLTQLIGGLLGGLNLGVLNLIISSSEINTIYKLNKDDELTFAVRLGGLVNLNLLTDREASLSVHKISN